MDLSDLWSNISSFTSNLIEPIKMGAQATADAFSQDVQDIQQHQLPRGAMRAGTEILGAYDNPFGVIMPFIPAAQWATKAFDPVAGWQTMREGIAPAVSPLSQFLRLKSDNLLFSLLNDARRQQLQNMGMEVY